MGWRYGRFVVEHPLPVGVSERRAVGERVRLGETIADGTVIGVARRVRGARRLGVPADDLARVSRVRVGAEVPRGTVLARTGRRFARAVTAPIDGRLVHRTADGDLLMAPVLGRWTALSAMEGAVVRSDDAAVSVEGEAWCLAGLAAYGPDAFGELALAVDAPVDELSPSRIDVRLSGHILVGGARMAAEAITRAHACDVSGLVGGAAPAGGLRVVYGDDVAASGLPGREDRPTVLCLFGFGSAPLPREVFLGFVQLVDRRAAIHTASARLFVFAPPDAVEIGTETPTFALADDYGSIRPLEEPGELAGPVRFRSELEERALLTAAGPVPLPNVLPLDADR